jgi:hypothetical protein
LSVIREYFYTILFFLFEKDDNNNVNIELNIFYHRYIKYSNILKNIHKSRVITEKKSHLSGADAWDDAISTRWFLGP